MVLQVARDATEVAVEVWPVTLLLVSAVLASAVLLARQGRLSLRHAILSFLPFAWPAAITLCGLIFNDRGTVPSMWVRPAHVLILVLLISQVFLSGVLMWRLQGCYMFVVTVSVLAFWVSLGAGFLAVMSVNGDWL